MVNRKILATVLAGMMAAAMAVTVFAEETVTEETEIEIQTVEEDPFPLPEGAALLSDYGYVEGLLTEDGWVSEYLDMKYDSSEKVKMGVGENDVMNEYYERHGADMMVAANEMIALMTDGSYVQMMVEVNPNAEAAGDILENFASMEKVDLSAEPKKMEIAGKEFETITTAKDGASYLLGVSTDQENMAVAIKVKYTKVADLNTLLDGFASASDGKTATA